MQRVMVDLPDPDGPQITMRSLLVTRRLMSRSTWKSPYHLCTPIRSTATSVLRGVGLRPAIAAVCSAVSFSPGSVAGGEPGLDAARIAHHAVAEDHIDPRREEVPGGDGDRSY